MSLMSDNTGKPAINNSHEVALGIWLPLTLCHFQHFYLLLSGGAHFLNRGQDGRKRLDQSLFQSLLDRAGDRTGPSTTRRTHV